MAYCATSASHLGGAYAVRTFWGGFKIVLALDGVVVDSTGKGAYWR